MKLLRTILGIAVPPLGVFWSSGISPTFWLNVLLTLLAWLPGAIHSAWVMKKSEAFAN